MRFQAPLKPPPPIPAHFHSLPAFLQVSLLFTQSGPPAGPAQGLGAAHSPFGEWRRLADGAPCLTTGEVQPAGAGVDLVLGAMQTTASDCIQLLFSLPSPMHGVAFKVAVLLAGVLSVVGVAALAPGGHEGAHSLVGSVRCARLLISVGCPVLAKRAPAGHDLFAGFHNKRRATLGKRRLDQRQGGPKQGEPDSPSIPSSPGGTDR